MSCRCLMIIELSGVQFVNKSHCWEQIRLHDLGSDFKIKKEMLHSTICSSSGDVSAWFEAVNIFFEIRSSTARFYIFITTSPISHVQELLYLGACDSIHVYKPKIKPKSIENKEAFQCRSCLTWKGHLRITTSAQTSTPCINIRLSSSSPPTGYFL